MDDGLKTPFVEPVEINGKTFEQSDIMPLIRETVSVLKRGFNKSRESKRRHARFVLTCVNLGYATIGHSDRQLITKLAE